MIWLSPNFWTPWAIEETMFLEPWATSVNKEQRVNFSDNYYMYFGLITLF